MNTPERTVAIPERIAPSGKEALITVSVLVTREEYIESAALARRAQYAGRPSPALIFGVVLVVAGIAGAFFGRMIDLYLPAALCLTLLGLYFALYDSFFAPLFSRAAAAREFDEKPELQFASTYIFTEDEVTVKNSRLDGTLPLAFITRWQETPSLFLVYIGQEFRFVIPKRLLEDGGQVVLRELLNNTKSK